MSILSNIPVLLLALPFYFMPIAVFALPIRTQDKAKKVFEWLSRLTIATLVNSLFFAYATAKFVESILHLQLEDAQFIILRGTMMLLVTASQVMVGLLVQRIMSVSTSRTLSR